MQHSQALSLDQIHRKAPSVFAEMPFEKMSQKYRFFPTCEVVQALISHGFQPVSAKQSNTRIEGKANFTRHILRFRHADMMQPGRVGDEIPEIVLLNSHDGTSSYQLSLGIHRLVCSNGLIVKSAGVADIRVRHSGREDLISDVIEGSYQIIDEAPKALAQIEAWRDIQLNRDEQEVLAAAALEVRETTLEIPNAELLRARRWADNSNTDTRDLWRTMNVVQENLVKGGMRGRNARNELRRVRAVNSVDGDTKLNRALWQMAERMAAIKASA